jgi:ABC-type ATPase with predicted acetyltransferase domain
MLFLAGALISVSALAQDPKPKDPKATPVSDLELLKYAEVMDTVNEMSASVRVLLADMVKSDTSMNAARYNDLSKIINDDAKLAEAKATPEEIEFVKEVAAKKDEETARINATYQSLAKEYVTVPVFNKVKKALSADPVLKTRYDSLMVELGKDDPEVQP